MGLERIAAVTQGVHSNYEIDLFRDLIGAAAELTGAKDLKSSSLRVIADHIRACAFLILDGVLPSNEGRGYVLRRIIRRAIRHGYKLGRTTPFFYRLVAPLERSMGSAYPGLGKNRAHIERVLEQEEVRFAETLSTGMGLLEEAIRNARGKTIAGEAVFKLYDTYGFPVDLTADIARERGLTIDSQGFEAAMEAQRERARAASKFGVDLREGVSVEGQTAFSGYDGLTDHGRVVELIRDGAKVERLRAGEEGQVVLDRTPFYAEAGGQVGDQGVLKSANARFDVRDTQKLGNAHAHIGKVSQGELEAGDTVTAQVDAALRGATVLNHTATHLLHAALRKVLGTHVTQKGSHYQSVTPAELTEIERLVNVQIRANSAGEISILPFDQAVKAGAMALFGEKYEADVRVLKLGDFSMEICGGTHVQRTGDIGFFKIVSEAGIAAGVRRIEALTGEAAVR
jgi:alanyl-tRNA synthetase